MHRRNFLKTTGLLGVAGVLAMDELFASTTDKIKHLGLQLYTLRDDLPKDPKGILKKVASYGYTQLESYEGPQGMFWGMTAKDFQKFVENLGMKIVSSHCDIGKDFEKKASDAASIGMKYLICPYKGPQKSIEDFKRIAEEFNAKGEVCRKHGLRFAYHNHGYSFKMIDGQIPQDVMMNYTDPALVDFEMDMYWVVTGGADINHYLTKYKNRFRLCHIKDRMKNASASEDNASCILGNGSIDYASILKTAKKSGIEYFIVEQERYDEASPLVCVQKNAKYLKTLVI